MTTQLPGNTALPTCAADIERLAAFMPASGGYRVEDFFRVPEQTAFKLSPDGQYVAFLAPYERRKNIHVRKVTGEGTVRITSETARDITNFFWANAQRIVFLKDSGGNENYQLFAVDKDGGHPLDLTPFPDVTLQIIDTLEDNEDELIIGINKNNPRLFDPYRIHVRTGELVQLATNDDITQPIVNWITDHRGQVRIAIRMIGGINEQILYRRDEQAPFEEVITSNFKEGISPLFFDFDNGDVVFVASNLGRDKMVIVRYDMALATEVGEPLYAHPDVDVTQLHYSRRRQILTGVTYNTWKQAYHFFSAPDAALYQRWRDALGGYEITVVNHDKQEEKYLLRTYSDRSLGAYHVYDTTTDELTQIATVSPWLEEEKLAPMSPISFTARDGLTIHGYLTLPVGHTGGTVPLVLNPHGGPWVRDSWGYNPEVQLMAHHGLAVLQVNFRSSSGYGRAFWEAGFKQWGRAMQDDLTDAVGYVVAQGIADPAHVAIYGGSYGGYATLAGITFTPDLYACGIDYVGVSNLFTFMNTIPPYWAPYLDMLHEMVGHPAHDAEMMRAASPVFHVDNIKAPLLVAQGANDPRVNIDESDQIVAHLRARGIDVPYIVKYDEGHGFQNEENKIEFYRAMLGFLGKHLLGG